MKEQIYNELFQQLDINVAAISGLLVVILKEKFYNLLTIALSALPQNLLERVIDNCSFYMIATSTKGLYLPNTETAEKDLIIFPETLLEDKDGAFTILHEVAHFACGFERIRIDERDEPLDELLDEQRNNEETADALAFRWSKEMKKNSEFSVLKGGAS